MARDLSGTTVLVSGASSGIGAVTARHLAAAGATVALVARRADRLDAQVAAIRASGGTAHAVPADVTDGEQVRAAVAATLEQSGALDAIVLSAGVAINGPLQQARVEDWRAMVDLNIMGVLHCVHAALPHLVATAAERGVADVVTIGSVAGRVNRADNSVYAATKFAVRAFTDSVRKSLVGTGVRAAVVEPGMVATEMTAGHSDPFEFLQPDDIAEGVLHVLTRAPRAAVSELIVRPSGQER